MIKSLHFISKIIGANGKISVGIICVCLFVYYSQQQPHSQSCVRSVGRTLRHAEGSPAMPAYTCDSSAWRCPKAAEPPSTFSTSSSGREMAASPISKQTLLQLGRQLSKKHPSRSPRRLRNQRTRVPRTKRGVESWWLRARWIRDLQPDWKSQQRLSFPRPPLDRSWLSLEWVKTAVHPAWSKHQQSHSGRRLRLIAPSP